MSDEVLALDAQERARRAKAILDEPLFHQAQLDVRAAILAAWSSTSSRDQLERERLYCMDQMLTRVLRALRQHVETGKLNERELTKDKYRLFSRI